MDVRGHGRGLRSEEQFSLEAAADDAAALLDHLGAGPAVVVGYSMGGSIALLAARRHPGRVCGLVLQSTALRWREERDERILWRSMGGLALALRTGVARRPTERYLARAVRTNPGLGPVLPWLRAEAFRGDPADLAQAGRALGRFDARPFAAALGVPAAVVVTTDDRLVAAERQRALARAIPGARAVQVPTGHNAWLTQPDLLAGAMDRAVTAVVGGGPASGAFDPLLGRGGSATARGFQEGDRCPISSPC